MIINGSDYSPLVLAYLGDSFFETLTREIIVNDGNVKVQELNEISHKIVTAKAQAQFYDIIINRITENEIVVLKMGRNTKSAHRSKSASVIEYRKATGLECLYGYYYLSHQFSRAKELLSLCLKEAEINE